MYETLKELEHLNLNNASSRLFESSVAIGLTYSKKLVPNFSPYPRRVQRHLVLHIVKNSDWSRSLRVLYQLVLHIVKNSDWSKALRVQHHLVLHIVKNR